MQTLVSWNVNGIRACLKKGFEDYVAATKPDVICLQEVKAMEDQVEIESLKDYHCHWNAAEKKGYSGVVIYSREAPKEAAYGMDLEEHDKEGRVITLDFGDFYLVTVYTPNSQNGLLRLPYRQKWDADFRAFLQGLDKSKPVLFSGDLNVAHKEIDLTNPKSNRKNAGFTDEERAGFDELLAAGFTDTFRQFEEGPGHYTWWSYRMNARAKNVGWRIDYWCVSSRFMKNVKSSVIQPEVMGSDHCPVKMEIG